MSERLTTTPQDKIKITDTVFLWFDPDGNIDVHDRRNYITIAMKNYNLSDYDIRMKLSSLLKGRDRMWDNNWLVTTSRWEELRGNLITTFEPDNGYSHDITRFREHNYDSSKDIAEFLSRSWILWTFITKDNMDHSDAVKAVIRIMNDEHLRIELMNANATSLVQLIFVLCPFVNVSLLVNLAIKFCKSGHALLIINHIHYVVIVESLVIR
ncbi:hypothetical protein EVAR_14918_1 [Eumeta japonica]|uniref:Uncharacterized protein n=1 Tax=Eumeta variegata TaxID=151549 RepID=A0A4C1XMJ8_EUMVA|nr:hypothetical protein EVAR_14918_1 [Eumeta japonica]